MPHPSPQDEHVDSKPAAGTIAQAGRGSCLEVFLIFLRLGFTSFGGPVAHLGYFRSEFVDRRRWLDDYAYSDLVALCQFLPGPASSQVGMAIGLRRAGWAGMLAAWVAFTLPSALALIGFALGLAHYGWLSQSAAVHGLKVAAVAIVAQAVWGMGRSLCPDRSRAALAVAAALITVILPTALAQMAAVLLGAVVGAAFLQVPPRPILANSSLGVTRWAGWLSLGLFIALLAGLPAWALLSNGALASQIDGFYRAGALVFGGGHVVLPLLETASVSTGMVSSADFLAGYGAAQAMPGPLFTFAAFLGALASGPLSGWAGGLALLCVIFLPGALLLTAALPFWESLRRRPGVRNMVAGVNASVVGILLGALYDPVWTSAILGKADFGLALLLFALLVYGRWSPVWVVLLAAAGGWTLGWLV
ncbi:chromate efflux transporter [Achromobacter arsenitoxydans]|uniref:Chromate transporter chromate ion transporter (CHR) family protein n=1 Tax=Achromobacter arsenitoxydans SY8 TaxID=477184 RepID=H0F7Y3_9BURK|nr:chromate efflux transporter [Achromobacter arsenitoxydans]EHK65416.1 chromate transporter chromate ion transporter (CHR) family protein [Achromobacter arsenitoxydans SY8]